MSLMCDMNTLTKDSVRVQAMIPVFMRFGRVLRCFSTSILPRIDRPKTPQKCSQNVPSARKPFICVHSTRFPKPRTSSLDPPAPRGWTPPPAIEGVPLS